MNVIFVLTDSLRRDFLGCYGNRKMHTPNFDRLAEMGILFEQARMGSFPCMPARREILTGRFEFPWRGWGPMEDDDVDLVSLLGRAGRTTMLVTDHYHFFERGAGNYHFSFSGWEFIRGNENDHWMTSSARPVSFPAPEYEKQHTRWRQYWQNTSQFRDDQGAWRHEHYTFAGRTFGAAIEWLEANHTHDGFFLMIDCFDPHEPFDPPAPYDHLYGEPSPDGSRIPWPIYGSACRYTSEELAGIQRLYAGEVSLVDAWLGRLLDKLEELGRLSDTAIIATTDHGYLFGEHRMIGKPSSHHGDSNLYEPLARIPLLFYHPEWRGAGLRLDQLVQPVDYFSTILDLMGVDLPHGVTTHGQSLVRLLHEPCSWQRQVAAYGKFGESINVADGRYTLMQWPPGPDNSLYWYSTHQPRFLVPREMGELEREQQRRPVSFARGPCNTALYDLQADPAQEDDISAQKPGELERLQRALAEWLVQVRAPQELAERLGL
jgi:arylsulfatase A-like enzyme